MRTVIYARYSSQLQNPRSVADQLAACRERACREGWTVAAEFADEAISGAAGIEADQRPGLHALLARVEAGGVDQVLAEATDRLARHAGDAYAIRERIEFAGARLFTLIDGEVDDITGTIKGLFDSKMRKDLAHRVRRGHLGNIERGRAASGVAYGYRKVSALDEKGNAVRGLREIDPETAAIVRRCFAEYARGESALAIVKRLNAEGVPPPKSGIWRASALIGGRAAASGMLRNPIYVGRLAYGRTRAVVDPKTRARRMRPGAGDVREGEAPHLRVVGDDLWEAVQRQLEARATDRPERQRRPKHLLSGLGVCGICGANWIKTRGRYWGCSAVVAGGACANRRLINTGDYERRVLDELKERMLAPDVVAAYAAEYARESARRSAAAARNQVALVRRRDEAARKVDRLVAAIAEGLGEFAEIRSALAQARADRDRARRELAAAEALPVLTLHPGIADQYRRAVEQLHEALADEHAAREAGPKLRALIERIEARPSAGKRGVDLKVIRRIDEVLTLAAANRIAITAC